MNLAELTWKEVQKYLKKNTGLIIPSGILEQHSVHLPLNTDTLVVEYICDYLSRKTGLLVAPTLNYGIGLPCDRFYPGSTTIHYKDLKNILSSLICWWKYQGFKKFFIVSAHGDYFHIKALKQACPKNTFVLELYDINLTGILKKQKHTKHACESETSVMLYLFPKTVRKEKIKDFETPCKKFKPYLYHTKKTPIKNSPGCQGYSSFATKEKGKKIVRLMKENAQKWIKKHL